MPSAADRTRAGKRSLVVIACRIVKLRRILLAALLLVLAAGGVLAWQIGPRNIIGMLLYYQRREGRLRVGDAAPDVALEKLEGGDAHLSDFIGGRPLVLIFGSFT